MAFRSNFTHFLQQRLHARQQRRQRRQRRQRILNHIPYGGVVYPGVAVDQRVAKGDDLRQAGYAAGECGIQPGELPRRFTDDFKLALDR